MEQCVDLEVPYMVSMETDQETMQAGGKIWLHQENKYEDNHWLSQKHLKEYQSVESLTV